jgi:hypothetical protein
MANDELTDEGPPQSRFSRELTRDIAQALGDYLRTYGPEADQTLQALTNRVCAEAKLLGLPPEKMLIEIKQLFERLPLPDLPHSERRRQTFERFISGCIESYFSADEA